MAPAPRTPALLTIGHSTLPFEEFLGLLQIHKVEALADIRLMPMSRRHPWFAQNHLRTALPAAGIKYIHFPDLGGMRKPRPDSPHTGWRNDHFRGYADYMETPAFEAALDRLKALILDAGTAIMCAEAVPWRCHRTLLSDSLTVRGIPVRHILGPGEPKPHRLTPFVLVDAETMPPRLQYSRAGADSRDEIQTRLL